MRTLIKFYSEHKTERIILEGDTDDFVNPQGLWNDIKQAIKELKDGLWKDDYPEGLTFENLLKRLLAFDGYRELCEEDDKIYNDYECIVRYENSVISYKAFNGNGIVYDANKWITDTTKNEGNCIDDFLKRGVIPQRDTINELIDNIKSRVDERQVAIEYHQTGCYEKDFTQISLIRRFAQKIVDNCDIQLERISEKYTKLS